MRPDAETLNGKRDLVTLSTLLYHGIRRAELGKTESVGGGASADQGRKMRFMPPPISAGLRRSMTTVRPCRKVVRHLR
ncbi:hypothetical protein [Nitrosospira sp. NRS527]|uniref:hypothetical protein n=1 Tax=Nitrosospira sp. NRS527 TaxID=155925 RepID=UPI001BCCDB2D|nr:hypothetical protein [Nitrosospira sp. NRS527]